LVSPLAGLSIRKIPARPTGAGGISPQGTQDDFRAFDNEKNWNLLDVVGRIAEQHETTHSAVSLAWLLARRQTSSIIVGARTETQLEDNLRGLSVKLTSEDLKELDEASRPDWDYPWDVIRDAEAGDAQLLT
jgi:aryl-alcohol dehydrogenase-like predicted oxidoreductase